MSGTLYAYPNSFRANKILIAAQYSGQKVTVDPTFVAGETDKSPEFLKKFPFGKVPAYESGDVKLFQTNGIAHFVGNDQTRGGKKEAEVLQWIGFADNVILPSACTWVYPTQGITQYNKQVTYFSNTMYVYVVAVCIYKSFSLMTFQTTEKAKTDIKSALIALNDFLNTRTYLVGERVTQADISLACTFSMLYEHVMDPDFRSSFGNVTRWFVTLVNQPQFKSVVGEIKLCEKMAQFDPKKYNEIHGKAEKAPKGKKAGGSGDSKSPKPKETAAAPAEAALVKKDPWADLPNTTYDMDAFKRCYCNNGPDVIEKYFWENFDKEKYSIWRGQYRFNENLKIKQFMVKNLITGMCQRLEKMRKHSFGAIFIQKKDGQFIIDSIWFWRGVGLIFELSEEFKVDYESYAWTKLDSDCPTTKTLVREGICEQIIFDGLSVVEAVNCI